MTSDGTIRRCPDADFLIPEGEPRVLTAFGWTHSPPAHPTISDLTPI